MANDNIAKGLNGAKSGENPVGFIGTAISSQFDPYGLKVVVQRGSRQISCPSTVKATDITIPCKVLVLNISPPTVIGVIQT